MALTPREHFICHRLLPKMLNDPEHIKKMRYALWCFTHRNFTVQHTKINSHTYETIKSEYVREKSKAMTGKGNHFYGKKHSQEFRQRMRDNNPATREDIRQKLRGPRTGFKPHNHYTGWDESTKEKISNTLKGNKMSEETRDKMKASKKGLKWVHKVGEKPFQIHESEFDSHLKNGYTKGRGPKQFW